MVLRHIFLRITQIYTMTLYSILIRRVMIQYLVKNQVDRFSVMTQENASTRHLFTSIKEANTAKI